MLFHRKQMSLSLSDLVPSNARSLATDPHDKVYALMGMAPDDPVRQKPTVDYDAPIEQVYCEYFKEASDYSKRLLLLCLAGISFRSTLNLPTFVPDWTRAGRSPAYPMLGKHSLENPGLHPADLHFHVDLLAEWSAASTAKAESRYLRSQ
jgi:hypothetical protein